MAEPVARLVIELGARTEVFRRELANASGVVKVRTGEIVASLERVKGVAGAVFGGAIVASLSGMVTKTVEAFGASLSSVVTQRLSASLADTLSKAVLDLAGVGTKGAGFDLGGLVSKAGAWLGGVFGFADGDVMTSAGSLPLHKYANGGVATSPQLALFGEGRTPEAYVPLPDGRRIPVAMQGGGAGGVAYHFSIDARGADPSVAARIEEGVQRAVRQSVGTVQSLANRGGSFARAVGRL